MFEDWMGGRDFFVGRTLDQSWYWKREQLETNISSSVNETNNHLVRPQQPSFQKKEFVFNGEGGDARKFSFGGSDENAVVGYWRFEELEETSNGSRSLDLSRFGNHGILIEGAEYSDSAHTCTRLEMGGRRHAHALRVKGGQGGMKVPIHSNSSSSLDLGIHSNDPRNQSFTLEFWLFLERTRLDGETVLFERVAQNSPWRLVVENEDGVESIWFESPEVVYVCTNPDAEIGRLTGEWRHIALTSTTMMMDGDGGAEMKIGLLVDGTMLTLQKQRQTRYDGKQQVIDSEEEYLQIGGEGLHCWFLEMRLWAVAREQWEIAQMMETYLNLAERVPMRINSSASSSTTPTKTTTATASLLLAPPPPPSSISGGSMGSGRKSSASTGGRAASTTPNHKEEEEEESNQVHPPRKKTPSSSTVENFINPFAAEDPFSQMDDLEEEEPSQVSFDYKDPQQLSPFNAFGPSSIIDSIGQMVVVATAAPAIAADDETSNETPFLVPTQHAKGGDHLLNDQNRRRRRRGSTSSSVHSNQNPSNDDDDDRIQVVGASSKNEKSQQAGSDPWKKVRDEATGADYFFNIETGESVWTDPRVSDSPWDAITDDDGQVYYYNRVTGETTWDKPIELIDEDDFDVEPDDDDEILS